MEELVEDRPWSTVWRLTGEGETLWRKRCKSIWRFEPRLTVSLADRWPDRLPEVVEHGDDWLIMRDAGAKIVDAPNAPAVWLEAVARYAELQRGEICHVAEHLAAGVPDQRRSVLPRDYADMLERDELPWQGDQRTRLRRFEPQFAELCADLGDVVSIQHDDLHIHNVYEGPRILDWGDSCVSHPFFSLVVTFMFVDASEHAGIRDAYLEAYATDRDAFDLALRIGRIAHVFKWIRIRDVLPPSELPEYDGWFTDWIEQAAAQTDM